MRFYPPPIGEPHTDKNGYVTPIWARWYAQGSMEGRHFLSNEGYRFPDSNTAQITPLAAQKNNGLTVYDKEVHKLKVIEDGLVRIVTTTPTT